MIVRYRRTRLGRYFELVPICAEAGQKHQDNRANRQLCLPVARCLPLMKLLQLVHERLSLHPTISSPPASASDCLFNCKTVCWFPLQEIKEYAYRRARYGKRIAGASRYGLAQKWLRGFRSKRIGERCLGYGESGRITYLSADHKQLMLDNNRMFTLMKSSELGDVAVGDRVDLKLKGTESKEVTEVKGLS